MHYRDIIDSDGKWQTSVIKAVENKKMTSVGGKLQTPNAGGQKGWNWEGILNEHWIE